MKNLSESILHELTESTNVDVNNLTKEQLWKLRQEIVLGSLYTSDYNNSFGIDPSAVCNFFDSFIEDSQVDDYGKPNNRETKDYDNAEDLYNYYRSCENPFGEIENINESSSKHKLKEDVDWSKQLDRKVIEEKNREIRRALKEYFTAAGYEVLGVHYEDMWSFNVEIFCSYNVGEVAVYLNTRFSEFSFSTIHLLDTRTVDTDDLDKLSKLAQVASNINNSLNLLDIIK